MRWATSCLLKTGKSSTADRETRATRFVSTSKPASCSDTLFATIRSAPKGADLIVANNVSLQDAGFDVETNRVALVSRSAVDDLPVLSKHDVAHRILDAALKLKAGMSRAR